MSNDAGHRAERSGARRWPTRRRRPRSPLAPRAAPPTRGSLDVVYASTDTPMGRCGRVDRRGLVRRRASRPSAPTSVLERPRRQDLAARARGAAAARRASGARSTSTSRAAAARFDLRARHAAQPRIPQRGAATSSSAAVRRDAHATREMAAARAAARLPRRGHRPARPTRSRSSSRAIAWSRAGEAIGDYGGGPT